MALTAETLARHELVGLDATVASAANPDLVGVGGRVVTETTNTLGLEAGGRVRHVPKEAATLEFELPSGGSEASASETSSGDEPRDNVTVRGDRLVARPARRTEVTGDSTWR